MLREIYKLFIECSLYEDVNVANQCSDQKSYIKGTDSPRLSWVSCNALCHDELMKNS